jgi:plastocyanin
MRGRWMLPVLLVMLMTGAAACSGSEDAESGDDDSEGAQTATITIARFAFDGPAGVSVGDTVTVVNDDTVTHTWTAREGPFDSGAIDPGTDFTYTFDESGAFDYFCAIHPTMEGTISVSG